MTTIDEAVTAAATVYHYLRRNEYPRHVSDQAYLVWDRLERDSRAAEKGAPHAAPATVEGKRDG